jgi:hypothetical protein
MRDVLDIARIRQRDALPQLLREFAAQAGQLLNITKAGQAAGLESSTANRYATLLEAAFITTVSRRHQATAMTGLSALKPRRPLRLALWLEADLTRIVVRNNGAGGSDV